MTSAVEVKGHLLLTFMVVGTALSTQNTVSSFTADKGFNHYTRMLTSDPTVTEKQTIRSVREDVVFDDCLLCFEKTIPRKTRVSSNLKININACENSC